MPNRLTAIDFRMNKEMVERYLKMIKEFDEALDKLEDIMPIHTDRIYCWGSGVRYVEKPLYFEDGTYILDDWERAKEHNKQYVDKIIASETYKESPTEFGYDLLKCKTDFDKVLYTPLNILVEEYSEYWLPLLQRQAGAEYPSHILTKEVNILKYGFVNTFCFWLDRAIQLTYEMLAEADSRLKV